ncbi:hypothetical protein [Altererythrobacter sp. MTPC7]|uniref:hypothetical protein n=1 Tax=Altererythrobacter sp. MTPC7 TaxID=3056567 RepID=UPI0036F272D8
MTVIMDYGGFIELLALEPGAGGSKRSKANERALDQFWLEAKRRKSPGPEGGGDLPRTTRTRSEQRNCSG